MDHKAAVVLRFHLRGFFPHIRNVGAERPAFEQPSQLAVLLRRAHGKHFHAAVPEVSHEAAESQSFRGALREKTEAHALDHSGHKIAFR